MDCLTNHARFFAAGVDYPAEPQRLRTAESSVQRTKGCRGRVNDDVDVSRAEDSGLITATDGRLYFDAQGAGRPIALLHAGVTDCRMWEDALMQLAPAFRVIRYDQRGGGRSSATTAAYADYEDLA